MHGQSTYVPAPANCGPLYSEAPPPGYYNQMFPPTFNHPLGFPQSSCFPHRVPIEEGGAITIKKEPNYHMPSPTFYPEDPYHQVHFPFPPVCRPRGKT